MNLSVDGPGHIVLFISRLTGGGVQRSMRNLAVALAARGYRVELLVCRANARETADLDRAGVRCETLKAGSRLRGRALALRADAHGWRTLARPVLLPVQSTNKLRYLAALSAYLRRERPDYLIAAMTQCNLVALWARTLAGTPTRVAISERNVFSRFVAQHRRRWRWRYLPALIARTYRRAEAVIAVSNAVADDLAVAADLERSRIAVIANPVVDAELETGRAAPLAHPWFSAGAPPVILGVGRLVEQKDPATLMQAFAHLRAERHARLIWLGDGPLRPGLAALVERLGVGADVELVGWVDNPFAYMARASALASSSLWEGLPGVLIQAMACGCPVVATDCPGGSADILDHGRYGRLVETGNAEALAAALAAELDTPTPARTLRERASHYTSDRAARRYMAVLGEHDPTISPGTERET